MILKLILSAALFIIPVSVFAQEAQPQSQPVGNKGYVMGTPADAQTVEPSKKQKCGSGPVGFHPVKAIQRFDAWLKEHAW
jgi:hypothetical protein